MEKISKYLSYILRHKPDSIGLSLDDHGWIYVNDLIANTTTFELNHALLDIIVEMNDKQRFAFNEDKTKIRANQGHSIYVDLDLRPHEPPSYLYHGTASRFLESIQKQGLIKGNRHHVHLTESAHVAQAVGQRYGKLVLLQIDTAAMAKDGCIFYKTANNVWLVDAVPREYLSILG